MGHGAGGIVAAGAVRMMMERKISYKIKFLCLYDSMGASNFYLRERKDKKTLE
jgi:hypothetical protein